MVYIVKFPGIKISGSGLSSKHTLVSMQLHLTLNSNGYGNSYLCFFVVGVVVVYACSLLCSILFLLSCLWVTSTIVWWSVTVLKFILPLAIQTKNNLCLSINLNYMLQFGKYFIINLPLPVTAYIKI